MRNLAFADPAVVPVRSPVKIQGAITDLVTPFAAQGIDRVGLMALIEWQIRNGISGLSVCGASGEGSTLSDAERAEIIAVAAEIADRKIPVIADCSSHSTQTAVLRSRAARGLGADAILSVVPYYSKPTQDGIVRHFEAIAASTDLPLIIDNAPSRTATDLAPATIDRLASLPTVVGLCDGTGDLSRFAGVPAGLKRRLAHLSGHDATALAFLITGGRGSISAIANLVPRLAASLHHAALCGHIDAALNLQDRLEPVQQALAREPGPAAIKYALQRLRGLSAEVRLPLTAIDARTQAAVRLALEPFEGDRMDVSTTGVRRLDL